MSNMTDTFSNPVTQVPVMGLTSTITEEVNVGRDQFMSAYEDPLGAGWVFQVHLDVNSYLAAANVTPPENESIAGIAMGDTRVSFDQVGAFEAALKANWATMTSVNTSQTGVSNGVPLTEQVRLFLADFFDKNKELNAIVATNAAAADASAIAYLDSTKITSQLTTFTQATGTSSYEPALYADGTLGTTLGEFIAGSGKPKDTTSLCANLLSVRQVVQVLEAYAALGVGGSNSRVIRVGGDYQYKLHAGDSIIGECTIVDSDAANVGSQYKTASTLPVKVQLVQTLDGAFDALTDLSSVSGVVTPYDPLVLPSTTGGVMPVTIGTFLYGYSVPLAKDMWINASSNTGMFIHTDASGDHLRTYDVMANIFGTDNIMTIDNAPVSSPDRSVFKIITSESNGTYNAAFSLEYDPSGLIPTNLHNQDSLRHDSGVSTHENLIPEGEYLYSMDRGAWIKGGEDKAFYLYRSLSGSFLRRYTVSTNSKEFTITGPTLLANISAGHLALDNVPVTINEKISVKFVAGAPILGNGNTSWIYPWWFVPM
jgi:hypothetical protein